MPVSILQSGPTHQVTQVMLDTPTKEVRLSGVEPGAWVKLNPEVVGFYRVAYGKEELEQLCDAIKTMSLPNLDRKGNHFLSGSYVGRHCYLDHFVVFSVDNALYLHYPKSRLDFPAKWL